MAKVKSSVIINSLDDVICGLLENSLDAGATKLVIQIQRSRGACTVHDNGVGVEPCEFANTGGLCKLHYTSKADQRSTYGQHGAFLASLAALSLVDITSKHEGYRSVNRITIHRTVVLSRATPFDGSSAFSSQRHGTEVAVQDLFGNMPVRVKSRQIEQDRSTKDPRHLSELKLRLVAYLLAWQQELTIKLRDHDSQRDTVLSYADVSSAGFASFMRSHGALSSILDELMPNQSWIPASATSSTLTISGIIGSRPVATRAYQFLSLGAVPILPGSELNELHNHINKLFDRSNFGVIDTNTVEGSKDRLYEARNNTFKLKDLRTSRKGVDRWPMYSLRINFRDAATASSTAIYDLSKSLEIILHALDTLIDRWLSTQHIATGLNYRNQRKHPQRKLQPTSNLEQVRPRDVGVSCSRERTIRQASSVETIVNLPISRINIGPSQAQHLHIQADLIDFSNPNDEHTISVNDRTSGGYSSSGDIATSKVLHNDLPRDIGSSVRDSAVCDGKPKSSTCQDYFRVSKSIKQDELKVWTDPITLNRHTVNTRTGMPEHNQLLGHRLTLRPSSAPQPTKASSWLDEICQNWINPVYDLPEQQIHQLNSPTAAPGVATNFGHRSCAHESEAMVSCNSLGHIGGVNKISKDAVKRFRFISQVDHRFILVALPSHAFDDLVIVDQHAADERIKVEALYAEICSNMRSSPDLVTRLRQPLIFEILSHEAQHFIECRADFGNWAVQYTVVEDCETETTDSHYLNVVALPTLIADRCIAEPKVLLAMLRQHIWASRPTHRERPRGDEHADTPADKSWLTRIGGCPQGLRDMINSRACRSAIMFNDALSPEDCVSLLTKLAECAFPFQCAHGRPSMVPLLRIDRQAPALIADPTASCNVKDTDGFLQVYKSWTT